MKVISKWLTKTPMERKPRVYITDAEAKDVPNTAYYRRLIRDGSLELAKGSAEQEGDE